MKLFILIPSKCLNCAILHKTDVSRDTDEPSSLCTYNRGSALNALANESDWTCYISHMEEQIIPGNSNELLELLSSYREKCFFGKVGVWEPHHLCITTGSKQLRNLVESCSLCLGTLPSEKTRFTVEANKKVHISFSQSSVPFLI